MIEMNAAVMVKDLDPMIGWSLGPNLFNLARGHNHLDLKVENYDGGEWGMRQLPNGEWVPVLPQVEGGTYRVINPANYSSEEMTPESAGVALWLIALSAMSFRVQTNLEALEAVAKAHYAVYTGYWDDKTLEHSSIARLTD